MPYTIELFVSDWLLFVVHLFFNNLHYIKIKYKIKEGSFKERNNKIA